MQIETNQSEYSLPIFISSTIYNLIDLRAELAYYLRYLGYKPYLSEEGGFPDNTPEETPYESCLEVIDHCQIVIIIIDGKYGQKFSWPTLLQDKQISPTHAEYLYAKEKGKKILVFIRKELMTIYQQYRKVKSDVKSKEKDESEIKKVLSQTLVDRIDFEIFPFINEVKTQKPIPWIIEFDTVVDIKIALKQKLNNFLAEIFLIKDKHVNYIIKAFNELLESATLEKRKEILDKNGFIRSKFEELEKYEAEINRLTQVASTDKTHIGQLQNNINKLNDEINKFRLTNNYQYYNNNFEYSCCAQCGCNGIHYCNNDSIGTIVECIYCRTHFCKEHMQTHYCINKPNNIVSVAATPI